MNLAPPLLNTPPTDTNSCAVLITYNPDSQFVERLSLIRKQFLKLVIIDNASSPRFQTQLHSYCKDRIQVIQNPRNLGLATALNQGIDFALAGNFTWVATFDQDSVIYPAFFPEIVRIYDEAVTKPDMIGCNYFHETLHKPAITTTNRQRFVERKTLISSGTFIRLALFETLGKFRGDYFIDSVDHEFSLRARRSGYRLLMSTKVLMRHAIGTSKPVKRRRFFNIPEHGPLRKYYISRNCLVTVSTYFRYDPLWCLKQLSRLGVEILSIVLCESEKRQKLAAMGLGAVHAALGKMGELSAAAENR